MIPHDSLVICLHSDLVVTILFAKSPIAYYFLPFLASGEISQGHNQICLKLFCLVKEGEDTLINIAKEIEDTSSPGIKTITVYDTLSEAVADAHIIVIFPTKKATEELVMDPFLRTIGPTIYSYAGYSRIINISKNYLNIQNIYATFKIKNYVFCSFKRSLE